MQNLPCKKEKSRIVVEETLEAQEFSGVWAAGDCAWIPNSRTGKPHPPIAQHALREAVHCAKNIVAAVRGERFTPFTFTTIGQLATIGRPAVGVPPSASGNFRASQRCAVYYRGTGTHKRGITPVEDPYYGIKIGQPKPTCYSTSNLRRR